MCITRQLRQMEKRSRNGHALTRQHTWANLVGFVRKILGMSPSDFIETFDGY